MKIIKTKLKNFEQAQASLIELIQHSNKREEYLAQRSKNKKKKVSNQERLFNNIKVIQGVKQELETIRDIIKDNFALFLFEVG